MKLSAENRARAKRRYKLRQQTVEPVFGIIKSVMGFRQFLLRGVEKVGLEWRLVCVAYNLKRLHRIGRGLESGRPGLKIPEKSPGGPEKDRTF